MNNGSWEKIYTAHGRVQIEVLDSVVEAAKRFSMRGYREVLDLGCGTGRHTLYLADSGFSVSGCDIAPSGVAMTRGLLEEHGFTGIDIRVEDMRQLRYADDSFDSVLCIWTQGHGTTDEMWQGISEIHRVLRPGGTVVTDFVNRNDRTCGLGEEIEPWTFVGGHPGEEDIPHHYCDEAELRDAFGMYSEVSVREKVYTFPLESGEEYRIDALLVTAVK